MDNQQQDGESVAKDWTDFQMPETRSELLLQCKLIEQGLKHDQACEGGQSLVFKPNLGDKISLAMNVSFARLHNDGLLGFMGRCGATNFTNFEAVF